MAWFLVWPTAPQGPPPASCPVPAILLGGVSQTALGARLQQPMDSTHICLEGGPRLWVAAALASVLSSLGRHRGCG